MRYVVWLGILLCVACEGPDTVSDGTSVAIAPDISIACVQNSASLRFVQGDRSTDVTVPCASSYLLSLDAFQGNSVEKGDLIELRNTSGTVLARSVIAKSDTKGARVGFSQHTTRIASILGVVKTTGENANCVRYMAAWLVRNKTMQIDLGTKASAIALAMKRACGAFTDMAAILNQLEAGTVDLSSWEIAPDIFLSGLTHQDMTDAWVEKDSSETFYNLMHASYPFFYYPDYTIGIWNDLYSDLTVIAPMTAEQAHRMERYSNESDMFLNSYESHEASKRADLYSAWLNGWAGYYDGDQEKLVLAGYLDQTFDASDVQTQNKNFIAGNVLINADLGDYFYPALEEVFAGASVAASTQTLGKSDASDMHRRGVSWSTTTGTARNYTLREAMGMIAASSYVGPLLIVGNAFDFSKLTLYNQGATVSRQNAWTNTLGATPVLPNAFGSDSNAFWTAPLLTGTPTDAMKLFNILSIMKSDLDVAVWNTGEVSNASIATAMTGSSYATKLAACNTSPSTFESRSNCGIALSIQSALRLMALDPGGVTKS